MGYMKEIHLDRQARVEESEYQLHCYNASVLGQILADSSDSDMVDYLENIKRHDSKSFAILARVVKRLEGGSR